MKVLFIHNCLQSFVRTDLELIKAEHAVVEVNFRWSPGCILRTLVGAYSCDLVFGWFCGHHLLLAALLARILGKRLVVASSDYDLANEPWFNYGSMRPGIRKWINNAIFTWAERVIVPSQFSRDLALRNTVLKDNPEKLDVIPHGFAAPAMAESPKRPVVITVGALNQENWIRKGHREFIEVARHTPAIQFYLVGPAASPSFQQWAARQAPANLAITGFLPDSRLWACLSSAQVYLQLSFMEGFGCSVAEGMLARCIPVVCRSGALPEVVGDCGYYVRYGDVGATCEAVARALQDPQSSARARRRVLNVFSLERRRVALREVLGKASRAEPGKRAIA